MLRRLCVVLRVHVIALWRHLGHLGHLLRLLLPVPWLLHVSLPTVLLHRLHRWLHRLRMLHSLRILRNACANHG